MLASFFLQTPVEHITMKRLPLLISALWMASVSLYGTEALGATRQVPAATEVVQVENWEPIVQDLVRIAMTENSREAASSILNFIYLGRATWEGVTYVSGPSRTPITPEETVELQNFIIMAVVAGGYLDPLPSAQENMHQKLVRFTYLFSQARLYLPVDTPLDVLIAEIQRDSRVFGTEIEYSMRLQDFVNVGVPRGFAERCRRISAEFAERRARRQQDELQRVPSSDFLFPPTGGPTPTSPRAGAGAPLTASSALPATTGTAPLPAAIDFTFDDDAHPAGAHRVSHQIQARVPASTGTAPLPAAIDFTFDDDDAPPAGTQRVPEATIGEIIRLYTTGVQSIMDSYALYARSHPAAQSLQEFDQAMQGDDTYAFLRR